MYGRIARAGRMRGHGRGTRCRRRVGPDRWEVHARVERFVEPTLLLLLAERPRHGYELLERIPEVAREERRMDLGNLYRVLRGLEEDGIVASQWDAGIPGPAKRVYRLTTAGETLLGQWSEALVATREVIDGFVNRYGERR